MRNKATSTSDKHIQLVLISDTHGEHNKVKLPCGDILIHAGDVSPQGETEEIIDFLQWFSTQSHKHKILIAGNHDWLFQKNPGLAKALLENHPGITYLQDDLVVVKGLKIYGSPWQPEFCGWAFNLPRDGQELSRVWSHIPEGVDILVTHTAPYGILDPSYTNLSVGCKLLTNRVQEIQPKLHIFGHLHEGYGILKQGNTTYINASLVNNQNILKFKPIVIDLKYS